MNDLRKDYGGAPHISLLSLARLTWSKNSEFENTLAATAIPATALEITIILDLSDEMREIVLESFPLFLWPSACGKSWLLGSRHEVSIVKNVLGIRDCTGGDMRQPIGGLPGTGSLQQEAKRVRPSKLI